MIPWVWEVVLFIDSLVQGDDIVKWVEDEGKKPGEIVATLGK